jgi:hypothetical protein
VTEPRLDFHPAANLFPLMNEADRRVLAEDIEHNGQRLPILTVDGKVIDGRNRYLACLDVRVEPWIEQASAEAHADPIGFVVSMNITRRHLSAGQRAIVAAEAWALAEQAGHVGQGRAPSVDFGGRIIRGSRSRELFADLFTVSPDYVQMARALLRESPSAAAIVKEGGWSLPAADRDWRDQHEQARAAAELEAQQAERRAWAEARRQGIEQDEDEEDVSAPDTSSIVDIIAAEIERGREEAQPDPSPPSASVTTAEVSGDDDLVARCNDRIAVALQPSPEQIAEVAGMTLRRARALARQYRAFEVEDDALPDGRWGDEPEWPGYQATAWVALGHLLRVNAFDDARTVARLMFWHFDVGHAFPGVSALIDEVESRS